MKFISIFVLITSPFLLLAQDFPVNEKGEIEYSKTISIDSASMDSAYISLLDWVDDEYLGKGEILLTDDNRKKIVLKSSQYITYYMGYQWEIEYRLTLSVTAQGIDIRIDGIIGHTSTKLAKNGACSPTFDLRDGPGKLCIGKKGVSKIGSLAHSGFQKILSSVGG